MEAPLSFVKYKLGQDYRRKSRGCAYAETVFYEAATTAADLASAEECTPIHQLMHVHQIL